MSACTGGGAPPLHPSSNPCYVLISPSRVIFYGHPRRLLALFYLFFFCHFSNQNSPVTADENDLEAWLAFSYHPVHFGQLGGEGSAGGAPVRRKVEAADAFGQVAVSDVFWGVLVFFGVGAAFLEDDVFQDLAVTVVKLGRGGCGGVVYLVDGTRAPGERCAQGILQETILSRDADGAAVAVQQDEGRDSRLYSVPSGELCLRKTNISKILLS
jgi:hypothetical protein